MMNKPPIQVTGPLSIPRELFQFALDVLAREPAGVVFHVLRAFDQVAAAHKDEPSLTLPPQLFAALLEVLGEIPMKKCFGLVTALLDVAASEEAKTEQAKRDAALSPPATLIDQLANAAELIADRIASGHLPAPKAEQPPENVIAGDAPPVTGG